MASENNETRRIIPNLNGDLDHIRNKLGNNVLATYLPEELRQYKDALAKVEGNPYTTFGLSTLIAFSAVFSYPATAPIVNLFTGLSDEDKGFLNTIGLPPAGLARIAMFFLISNGYGENATTAIQGMGILGTAGIIALLSQYSDNDFANQAVGGDLYYIVMLCNILLSIPLGCYPKIADIARQPARNLETREANLREITDITSVSMDLNWWQKKLTHILGQSTIKNIAIASALSNMGTGSEKLISLFLAPKFGLKATYSVILSIQFLFLIASRSHHTSSYEEQFLKQNLPPEAAHQMANFVDSTTKAPRKFLQDSTHPEQIAIFDACVFYAAFYAILVLMCSSGEAILENNGMAIILAALVIIGMADTSSIFRAVPAYSLFGLKPNQFILVCLAIMMATSLVAQLSPENAIWSLMLFSVANGCGNGVVVNKLTEEAGNHVPAGTALSTGIAIILAFFLRMAEASFDNTIAVICAAALTYGIAREAGWSPNSALKALSMFKCNNHDADEEAGMFKCNNRDAVVEMISHTNTNNTEEKRPETDEEAGIKLR